MDIERLECPKLIPLLSVPNGEPVSPEAILEALKELPETEAVAPYLEVLPKSALAPLLIVWLGANYKTIILTGMSVAIFGSRIPLPKCRRLYKVNTHLQKTR